MYHIKALTTNQCAQCFHDIEKWGIVLFVHCTNRHRQNCFAFCCTCGPMRNFLTLLEDQPTISKRIQRPSYWYWLQFSQLFEYGVTYRLTCSATQHPKPQPLTVYLWSLFSTSNTFTYLCIRHRCSSHVEWNGCCHCFLQSPQVPQVSVSMPLKIANPAHRQSLRIWRTYLAGKATFFKATEKTI